MKKGIVIAVMTLFCFSLHAMQPFARIARSGMSSYLGHEAASRSLHDIAHIKGLHRLGIHSPALGALALTPLKLSDSLSKTLMEKAYQEQNTALGSLTRSLFHQNPVDRKIEVTQYEKYMIRALPPTAIAHLIQAATAGKEKMKEETLIDSWA